MAIAESKLLNQYIESYVDSSSSESTQGPSLTKIVTLLKSGRLSMQSLVKELEMYLTTKDDILRAKGSLLLGAVLTQILSDPLDDAAVHSLIMFFSERLADWRALRGSLVGCLALMRRKGGGVVSGSDAYAFATSFLENLSVQSLGQHERKLCFELLECLLKFFPEAIKSLGELLVHGVYESISEEKDPQCLLLVFRVVELLGKRFPESGGPVSAFASDLFSVLGSYFPIHFTHATIEKTDAERNELSQALMLAFSSTPCFEPFAIPLLIEKLSSSAPLAKIDSLKYLRHCLSEYGSERTEKHSVVIWSSLKDILYTSQSLLFSFTPEYLDASWSEMNELVRESMLLLEHVIALNVLFVDLVVNDKDINSTLVEIRSFTSFKEIPESLQKKVQVFGLIFYVTSKVSVVSCNMMLEYFLPRLLETLKHSYEKDELPESSPFCSLFFCTELLRGSRDMFRKLPLSNTSTSSLLLQFHSFLFNIYSANLRSDRGKSVENANAFLGVNGMQILATFPEEHPIIPNQIFEKILMKLMEVIRLESGKSLLWKLALRALINIGSYVHSYNASERITSFINIIVKEIIRIFSSSENSWPLSQKLEILSNIASSGMSYMLCIVQALEGIIHTSFHGLRAFGNVEIKDETVQILECLSESLLPWSD